MERIQALALGLPHVNEEHRESVGTLLHLVGWRGARDEQHQVGVFRARHPYFLAVDHVAIARADRRGLKLRGVAARGRLGHAKRLEPQLAGGDLRQVGAFLVRRSVTEQRAHDVHLRVACRGVSAGAVDLLEDDGRFGEGESRAAVVLRNERGEVAGLGQRRDECIGVRAAAVELAPIDVGEPRAEFANGAAERCVWIVGQMFLRLGLSRAARSSSARPSRAR